MPRTRSLAWAELKIGVVTIVAVALAALLIFTLSGEGGFSWQRYPLKTVFPNVSGLNEGSPVRVAGVEVGTVTGIDFLGDSVEVSFEVGKKVQPRITTASTAALGSVSLLGESAVDIVPSSQGAPIPEWGYVKSGRAVGSIADVATQAGESLAAVTELIEAIKSGRGSIGRLFADDVLYTELNGLISAAEAVVSDINRGRGTLGRLVNDPAAGKALEASLQNLESVTSRLRAGEGSLGRLLNDDALAKSLTATTSNVETLTGRLNRGEGTAGKLLTDDALFNRFNSMSDRLDKLVASLQQGEGTAGQLLRDKQLYENMNGTVSELRGLLAEIKKDPKKYLNVRVSIF